MTTEGFIGSGPVAILDRLTVYTGVENLIGAAEDARIGAPPRITWVPPEKGGIATEMATFAIPDGDVQELQLQKFDVHIYASSYTELLALHAAIGNGLDIYFGPPQGQLPTLASDGLARPGYEFGAASSVGPVQRPEVAGAFACVCPATLKAFTQRATYTTTAPIRSVPVTVTTTDADGQNEQPAIP